MSASALTADRRLEVVDEELPDDLALLLRLLDTVQLAEELVRGIQHLATHKVQ